MSDQFGGVVNGRFSAVSVRAPNFHPGYRADIDGLRAVAILPVVGYHAFPAWSPGGFVGVDVFFVISGFLISTIIFRSLENGRFSFFDFYANRVRRIFPALILVMTACLIVGWSLLTAGEFMLLGKHVAAGAGFVENFVLWGEAGYFDINSELKPLLHLWSLAIEEQFYLVFPLFIWIVWRLRFNLLMPIVGIFLLSFALCQIDIRDDPVAAFFSPRTRWWELMAGAILAWLMRAEAGDYARKLLGKTVLVDAASLAGFGLIALAVFSLDRMMPYPGTNALLPVTGSVLLLFCGRDSVISRCLLSHPGAVFAGKISYPLYLWHWPLLSFLSIFKSGKPPDTAERAGVVVLSFVLAWLTFCLVERPIRQTSNHRRSAVVAGLSACIAALAAAGLNADRLMRPYDETTRRVMASWTFGNYPAPDGLHVDKDYGLPAIGQDTPTRILFFGDSHLLQYENTVAKIMRRLDAAPGKVVPEAMFDVRFTGFPHEMSPRVVADRTITTVVLVYFWALQYRDEKVNQAIRCCGSGLMGVTEKVYPPSTSEQMNRVDAEVARTVEGLIAVGKKVYIVLDNPFGEELAPRSMVKRSFLHGIKVVTVPLSRDAALRRMDPVRTRLLNIAARTGARVIDPVDSLCTTTCPSLSEEGSPLYKDYDHLSLDAVTNHVRYLDALFLASP